MSNDRELDEDGFPIYRPTAEEMARTRAQMETVVDCKALARTIMADRPAADPAHLEALSREHGIDGTKTLTELEGVDLGDANDVADDPIVRALRYVPLARWTPADVSLMLVYGHGIEPGMALAERLLRDDPLIAAMHYSGDLLKTFADLAPEVGKRSLVPAFVERAEASVWERFAAIADERDFDAAEIRAHRTRLLKGRRSDPGQNPFLTVERDLTVLAEVQDALQPPEILARATAKQLFAKYRLRKSVELVPLPDQSDADVQRVLEDPSTFKFRRDTVFTIAADRCDEGVRLRVFAQSAVNVVPGIWFESVAAAKAAAAQDYGVAADDWREPAP